MEAKIHPVEWLKMSIMGTRAVGRDRSAKTHELTEEYANDAE